MNPKRLARYRERRCSELMLVEVRRNAGVYALRDAWTVQLDCSGTARRIRTQQCYWRPPRPPGSPSASQILAIAAGIGAGNRV